MSIKLSIITPYYNTLKYTQRLANQLSPQLTDEVEWIIVDDGTNEYELDNLHAKVIHLPENSGNASRPRNVGIEASQGEFIAFIDSDDQVTNYYIEKVMNKINSEDFEYCYISWKTKDSEHVITDEPPEWNHCVWNCIYKKELIGNERFNENYNLDEDGDFNNRVRKGKRANIEDILYIYSWKERDDCISNLIATGRMKYRRD